jgi:hypothetical protein
VKYTEDLLLLAKKETVLWGVIDRLTEIRRWYGMEMNVEKTKVTRIWKQQSPTQTTIYKKTTTEYVILFW